MTLRTIALAALTLLLLLFVIGASSPPRGVVQEVLDLPGHVEPHTPGSGSPVEVAVPPDGPVATLLGPDPDLNRISVIRTFEAPGRRKPRAILVVIPGFLGGAKTFDPLARDMVEAFDGRIEVWAIDRRPNQLEDRLGAIHALSGVDEPACQSSPPAADCSVFEGVQFYFPDLVRGLPEDFPGPLDLDVDLDGEIDEQLPLVDDFGVLRGPQILLQDDARFMAHWGLDLYFRDWKRVIETARARVGRRGTVLLGGHSQGTTWATTFAAYDFDPDPGRVVAGHELIDGLMLFEGGGVGPGSTTKPTLAEYRQRVADLETAGGPDVFLNGLFAGALTLTDLGTGGETASIAGFHQPTEASVIQRTPVFGSGTIAILLGTPATNRAVAGFFLDDDFSPNTAFRASMGFSDDGVNTFVPPGGLSNDGFYIAAPGAGPLRTWKSPDDPTLPACPPNVEELSPGCAVLDNGPASDPALPASVDPPRVNGNEREVSTIDTFLATQFGNGNGFEWYFASGRPNLDFAYGRDSSALVAESLAADPGDEGPLVVTQNASMDEPVICFGGSNGLTPEPKSFDRYLSSIATPDSQKEVYVLEGYAHVDVLTANQNEVVPPLAAFVQRRIDEKRAEIKGKKKKAKQKKARKKKSKKKKKKSKKKKR